MILGGSLDLRRAEETWRLDCEASFKSVYPPRCVVMIQSFTFSRCSLVTASFVVGVWKHFS